MGDKDFFLVDKDFFLVDKDFFLADKDFFLVDKDFNLADKGFFPADKDFNLVAGVHLCLQDPLYHFMEDQDLDHSFTAWHRISNLGNPVRIIQTANVKGTIKGYEN